MVSRKIVAAIRRGSQLVRTEPRDRCNRFYIAFDAGIYIEWNEVSNLVTKWLFGPLVSSSKIIILAIVRTIFFHSIDPCTNALSNKTRTRLRKKIEGDTIRKYCLETFCNSPRLLSFSWRNCTRPNVSLRLCTVHYKHIQIYTLNIVLLLDSRKKATTDSLSARNSTPLLKYLNTVFAGKLQISEIPLCSTITRTYCTS